ncbi:hypothetical protein, partial [Corynebacterium sp.]|uniref:hypothetical protein n=1 Tax=Corynebacterium sp. TaxID=1720 RepID=UPI0034619CBE
MVIGSPAQDYARMASLCTSLRITVVMATYRLSLAHPGAPPPRGAGGGGGGGGVGG